ncbi:hypothetical protein SAMN04487785_103153 [Dyella jiangningensis]|uniref:hypothetical protein n=1 Tax=Dyella sp. AtDHG13 TaxID=1938897 RepID=UPI000888CBF9|nr:hypothetical protein [Dyella sp. AtDHG13]PXV61684.1 hypothetical protein BDW41_101430 [Dyella sp. AtDHG13]SDJ67324.1 hypothetical protein SAMN04487785_103153 [Dyella jiangningensis]
MAWMRSYAGSFAGYTLIMLLLFLPYLRGEVVAPTRLGTQFGIQDTAETEPRFENAKFSDYPNAFLPEIDAFLHGRRSGRVALWTSQNQLGRPLYHVSGFSPVYLPAQLLQALTQSPERFITAWSLLLAFLSGGFILLFCRQLGLTSLAGLTSAITYAASPLLTYWLAFPMFLAAWCWGAGCAWSLRRLADRADLFSWVCLCFCTYSLLMTSYPQLTVYQAYIVGGYVIVLLLRSDREGRRVALRFAFQAGLAGLAAVVLAAPILIDLFNATLQSARLRPDNDFFLAALPHLSSLGDIGREIVLLTTPNLFGVVTRPDYPVVYNGLSLCLLTTSLIVAGVVAKVRGGRMWWIAVVLIILVATVRPLYLFGVDHLGLGLSRTNPMAMLLMPCVMLQAYAIDALEHKQVRSWRIALITGVLLLALIGGSVAYGVQQGWPILRSQLVVDVTIVLFVMGVCLRIRLATALMLACGCWLAFAVAPTLLKQRPSQMHTQSPLVEAVAMRLHDHARFAIAAPGIAALPPNFNALVGLPSVHSYDSLSSRRYQQFLRLLGGEAVTFGRWNSQIAPDYAGAAFWMSDVALVLSSVRLTDPSLTCSTQVDGIWLCDVARHMGQSLQLADRTLPRETSNADVGDPRALPSLPSRVVRDQGDAIEVAVSAASPSLLIISQQYHPDWQALALVDGLWRPAAALSVNGFFQGVMVPDHAEKIVLTFRPAARYAYLVNYVWIFFLLLLATKALLAWQSKSGHTHE